MAKFERVKVELRGKVRMLSPRALEIASRHFGAKRQTVSEKQVPVELLVIPPKREIIKPKLTEVPPPVTPVVPTEAKVIEPVVKSVEVTEPLAVDVPKTDTVIKKGTKGTKKAKK